MNYFHRYNSDLQKYNQVMLSLGRQHNIDVIDLYNFTLSLGVNELYKDHVHFHEDIRRLQAAYIAGHLTGLKNPNRKK